MRVIIALAFVVVPIAARPARADSFVDITGGISIPLGDDDWNNMVESSPKLGLRVGALPHEIGGYVQADWVPENTDAQGFSNGLASADISAHRFRMQGGVLFRHPVSNTLAITGRGGIGADIAYASVSGMVLGQNYEGSQTDVGLGFEFAGGIWFKLGGMELGGEAAFPFSIHDDDNNDPDIDYQYTSYDFDLLFAVRFISR